MRDITLVILAGGQNSRMGTPKADLIVQGRPMLQYVLEHANWEGPTMLVTAPGADPLQCCERFDRQVCDPVAGVGPLRGVLTALENAETPIVVVAAVDMPGVGSEQLCWIADELLRRSDQSGVLLSRDVDGQRQIEPFPSAYRRSAADVIAAQLKRQRRALHSLLDCPGFCAVPAPPQWDQRTWLNLNTPDDLNRFLGDLPDQPQAG